MKRTTIGIDIAKNVFEIYVEDGSNQVVARKRLSRKKMLPWFANHPPALVGMEACGGAHYWARELTKLGHEVRLLAPQYVKPWVQTNKSDAADARAICRAVQEPGMRFVGMASEVQQTVQALHRVRSRYLGNRTALVNQIRGILLEYGVAIPPGVASVRNALPLLLAEERWSGLVRQFLADQQAELRYWDTKIEAVTAQIKRENARQPICQRLEQARGIGPLGASALWAKIAGQAYRNGRHVAAALGLVPKHTGTGGKVRLGGISKRGDRYLRQLLIHGARAVVRQVGEKPDCLSCWIRRVVARRGMNKAIVALANKNARMAFALLAKAQPYDVAKLCEAV
ncbi:IS110 family transposase [Nitrospira sp. T9]|uniref:IS110 family transposase n=1 Tax=unclassified Nitrospira TaxID=2652172 RepID=UPI003F94BF3E